LVREFFDAEPPIEKCEQGRTGRFAECLDRARDEAPDLVAFDLIAASRDEGGAGNTPLTAPTAVERPEPQADAVLGDRRQPRSEMLRITGRTFDRGRKRLLQDVVHHLVIPHEVPYQMA